MVLMRRSSFNGIATSTVLSLGNLALKSRRNVIVCGGLRHTVVCTEMKDLGGKSIMGAFVIERNAGDASKYGYQFEVQVGYQLQSFPPVSTHCYLTAERARGLANKLLDHR